MAPDSDPITTRACECVDNAKCATSSISARATAVPRVQLVEAYLVARLLRAGMAPRRRSLWRQPLPRRFCGEPRNSQAASPARTFPASHSSSDGRVHTPLSHPVTVSLCLGARPWRSWLSGAGEFPLRASAEHAVRAQARWRRTLPGDVPEDVWGSGRACNHAQNRRRASHFCAETAHARLACPVAHSGAASPSRGACDCRSRP